MKTKLLTLALFGFLTLGFVSCADEEIAPSNEMTEQTSVQDEDTGTTRPILRRD